MAKKAAKKAATKKAAKPVKAAAKSGSGKSVTSVAGNSVASYRANFLKRSR